MQKKKKMTIEKLAIIIQKGFKAVKNKIDGVKIELDEFRKEVNVRFDKIENISIQGHENRIENLEARMRKVETTLEK